jgi:quinol monooxygenase YgiN
MPVVVAIFDPKPGRTQDVVDAFAAIAPLVQSEEGCELYATHTDGDHVVMVERWSTVEDLQAHGAGEPLATLGELTADLLAKPYDLYVLDNVAFGDPVKGTIQ